ncbi:DUF805 domain-containing protein [Aquipuribacter sp. SD81]|uniref:DUF805 domain-containing protein n=1 Tax=Aquipuribacter sp. SD81 TaxID=3127703 RepID=UPI003017A4E6
MEPVGATGSVLRRYARFSGRASLAEYWWWLAVLAALALVVRAALAGLPDVAVLGEPVGAWQLALLPLLVPTVAVTARRLRDAGLSPWWQLLVLVPFGAVVVLTMCAFRPWQPSAAARAGLRPLLRRRRTAPAGRTSA